MPSEYIGHILKQENTWSYSFNGIYKNRESIAGIINAHLITETTERLTWGATDNNVYLVDFWILKTHFKKLVIAVALQIPVVRFYSSFHHFIAYGAKSCCLKTKRQTATTSKQVEHQRLLLNMRCKHPIYLIAKFRHYLIAHYKLVQRYNFYRKYHVHYIF